jgi:predicted DNA-binding transcriptional regulator AlpA
MQLLTVDEVMRRASISRSYLYKLLKLGQFPPPIIIVPGGRQGRRWIETEVEDYLSGLPRATYGRHTQRGRQRGRKPIELPENGR